MDKDYISNITEEQTRDMLQKMNEEEKDDYILFLIKLIQLSEEMKKSISDMANVIIDIRNETIDSNEKTINNLLSRLNDKELELLNKEAIMQIFDCQDDKALKILKLMYANSFGCKIGKEYYITRNEFKKFMDSYKGKDLKI